MTTRTRILGAALLSAFLPGAAQATAIVHFALADPAVGVGLSTTLEIRADLDTAVLGFGLDLALDQSVLTASGAPQIGPAWTPVFAPDGDGLAGLAPVSGVAGPDVLLAAVTVTRLAATATLIDGGVTPGDLSEGFPLLGGGFDAVSFVPLAVAALPEAGTVPLLALGLALLPGLRRSRTR